MLAADAGSLLLLLQAKDASSVERLMKPCGRMLFLARSELAEGENRNVRERLIQEKMLPKRAHCTRPDAALKSESEECCQRAEVFKENQDLCFLSLSSLNQWL